MLVTLGARHTKVTGKRVPIHDGMRNVFPDVGSCRNCPLMIILKSRK